MQWTLGKSLCISAAKNIDRKIGQIHQLDVDIALISGCGQTSKDNGAGVRKVFRVNVDSRRARASAGHFAVAATERCKLCFVAKVLICLERRNCGWGA